MAHVWIPEVLRTGASCSNPIEIEGRDVAEVLAHLGTQYPEIAHQIIDDNGKLRGFVRVFVDGQDVRDRGGMRSVVDAGGKVEVLSAVSGG